MINLLHISDLHYTADGEGVRRDYCQAAAKAILKLVEELQGKGILGRTFSIALTGDLVQAGGLARPHGRTDFEALEHDFLQPLRENLGIEPNRIFLVPGNHEMDRAAISADKYLFANGECSEADVKDDLIKKLKSYFQFVEKNGYKSVTSSSPRIKCFNIDGQQIVCFNALGGSYSRQGLGDKGNLFVLPTELAGQLSEIDDFAIVLMHHPLSWFDDKCEMLLRDFFAKKRCRVLTGHIHNQGLAEIETTKGAFVTIQAGASSEVGTTQFCVALTWLPPSNSAAVRHFRFDQHEASFPLTPVNDTKMAPQASRTFFERTEAFFDPVAIFKISKVAAAKAANDMKLLAGAGPDKYVPPDLMKFPEDQFSGRRVSIQEISRDSTNIVLSGDELSGKSSLLSYLCYLKNMDRGEGSSLDRIGLALDFRELQQVDSVKALVIKRITELGSTQQQADYLLEVGKVRLFIDNFETNDRLTVKHFLELSKTFGKIRWTVAMRGSERFMPSRAPSDFVGSEASYYQLAEITLPTVLKLIEKHEACDNAEKPRAVVSRVFQSIHNLSAPRTVFYVRSMLDIFLNDASVEPLNRYLLIENLISDRIRNAHREVFPGQPVDMQMLDAFIGKLAHDLLVRQASFVTKAEFLTLAESFIKKKGLQRKRFDPDKLLETLLRSHVLRPYEDKFGFVIMSVEDYFLAKHMSQDDSFRSEVLSPEGLLMLPAVAEYYIAQNPNDRPRIDAIFSLIDEFKKEVFPLINEIDDVAVEAIKLAAPGKEFKLQDDLLEEIAKIDGADDPTMMHFADPEPVGETRRVRYSVDERGAVFLQLGASILGVTRTLDQDDRIEIFQRLRELLLICVKGVPLIAQHLADGNEVRFRGTTVTAEYIGQLSVQEDRFYLILRGILHNLFKNFATWAGSPSFFNSALRLRHEEGDEIVSTALFAQNIEADLTEALALIQEVPDEVDSLVLQEIIVRLYLDAMTLVPLEREDEARAVDKLVDLTAAIKPPKNASSSDAIRRHKDKLRRNYSEIIGLNTYIGRRIRGAKRSKG